MKPAYTVFSIVYEVSLQQIILLYQRGTHVNLDIIDYCINLYIQEVQKFAV